MSTCLVYCLLSLIACIIAAPQCFLSSTNGLASRQSVLLSTASGHFLRQPPSPPLSYCIINTASDAFCLLLSLSLSLLYTQQSLCFLYACSCLPNLCFVCVSVMCLLHSPACLLKFAVSSSFHPPLSPFSSRVPACISHSNN